MTSKRLNSLVYRREQLACVNRELYTTTLDLLLEEQSDQGETARALVQRLSDWEDEQRSNPDAGYEGEGSDKPVRPSTLVTWLLGLK
jgi:hypothetical protein